MDEKVKTNQEMFVEFAKYYTELSDHNKAIMLLQIKSCTDDSVFELVGLKPQTLMWSNLERANDS